MGKETSQSAALKMMLAMGYKRGEALGKRAAPGLDTGTAIEREASSERQVDEVREADLEGGQDGELEKGKENARDDEQEIDEKDESENGLVSGQGRAGVGIGSSSSSSLPSKPISVPTSAPSVEPSTSAQAVAQAAAPTAAPSTEPLRIDERWLGGRSARHGIGSSLARARQLASEQLSLAISAAASPSHPSYSGAGGAGGAGQDGEKEKELNDFRSRTANEYENKRIERMVSEARKVVRELDGKCGVRVSSFFLFLSFSDHPSTFPLPPSPFPLPLITYTDFLHRLPPASRATPYSTAPSGSTPPHCPTSPRVRGACRTRLNSSFSSMRLLRTGGRRRRVGRRHSMGRTAWERRTRRKSRKRTRPRRKVQRKTERAKERGRESARCRVRRRGEKKRSDSVRSTYVRSSFSSSFPPWFRRTPPPGAS